MIRKSTLPVILSADCLTTLEQVILLLMSLGYKSMFLYICNDYKGLYYKHNTIIL